jgi:hypothetical protein
MIHLLFDCQDWIIALFLNGARNLARVVVARESTVTSLHGHSAGLARR